MSLLFGPLAAETVFTLPLNLVRSAIPLSEPTPDTSQWTAPFVGLNSSGLLGITLGNDTGGWTGIEAILGTLAATLGDDSSAVAALETMLGSLSVTLAGDTMAVAALETMLGTLAVTLADDTMSASEIEAMVGTLAATLGNDTMVALGFTGIAPSGVLTGVLGDDGLVAFGTVLQGFPGTDPSTANAWSRIRRGGAQKVWK